MRVLIAGLLMVALTGCESLTPRKVLALANTSHSTASVAARYALENCITRRAVKETSPIPCITQAEARDRELDQRALQLNAAQVVYEQGGEVEMTVLERILQASQALESILLLELTPEQREALK